MAVIVTQERRRERVRRVLESNPTRRRCTASHSLGQARCALVQGHDGAHLYATALAERWARDGRWPIGREDRPLAIPTP